MGLAPWSVTFGDLINDEDTYMCGRG